MDSLLVPKISKWHFLRGVSNSCHGVTLIGLEPTQKRFGEKISIILGTSPPQSLDTKRDAADVQILL